MNEKYIILNYLLLLDTTLYDLQRITIFLKNLNNYFEELM